MAKDILKLGKVDLKGPQGMLGKGSPVDKMLASVKNFFSRKK